MCVGNIHDCMDEMWKNSVIVALMDVCEFDPDTKNRVTLSLFVRGCMYTYTWVYVHVGPLCF